MIFYNILILYKHNFITSSHQKTKKKYGSKLKTHAATSTKNKRINKVMRNLKKICE